MKNFFEREEAKLKYVTERKAIRTKEKDAFDNEHTEVNIDIYIYINFYKFFLIMF